MIRFDYARPDSLQDAIRAGTPARAAFLAGGTNLIDLMKENVARPLEVVDINRLPLHEIVELDDGGLRLGALVTNSQTAYDARIQERYPMLASAILAGASPQLRNAATNGGNLNQRTRCYYFYDVDTPCNKRSPGQGCGAIGGFNRVHAVLGTSDQCIATHPSDMCVALAALEAKVQVAGPDSDRSIDFADYHRLPGDQPWLDNTLRPGEIVTAIDLPPEGFASNNTYLKLRDRRSYAFALVSIAVGLRMEHGRIAEARIAMGGATAYAQRRREAEQLLLGREPGDAAFGEAAKALLAGAIGQPTNAFKIELGRRGIVRALKQATAGTPQSQTDKRIA